jgi:hypothetical protein
MLAPWQIQTVPLSVLGVPPSSLADDDASNLIVNAIDLVMSRAHG